MSIPFSEVDIKIKFVSQVKRIHEYKRQLLNILGIVYRYKKMKEMTEEEMLKSFVPRVCIFGGKAFATYVQAKRIVKFITDVASTINHDPEIGDLLKVLLFTWFRYNLLLLFLRKHTNTSSILFVLIFCCRLYLCQIIMSVSQSC
jgi:glucan phosphorylase